MTTARSIPRRLSYANVASTLALVVAVGGGGTAVAAGLAKNSVKSPQIKNGSIKAVDVRPDTLTGAQIDESTLATVPSAAAAASAATAGHAGRADSAASADTVVTKRISVAVGQTVDLYAKGPFTVRLSCTSAEGPVGAALSLVSGSAGSAMDASPGDEYASFGPGDEADITGAGYTSGQDVEKGDFVALGADGTSLKGLGYVYVNAAGAMPCSADMTFFG